MLEMLEVVSPDTAVAAAPYQTTFSHAVDDIFRSLVIRGAASMLADDDSDMTFCVKLNSDSLARAVQYRGPAGGGSRLQLVDLQRLTVCAVDQERCRGYCFTTKANVQAVRLGHCPAASLGVQQSRKDIHCRVVPCATAFCRRARPARLHQRCPALRQLAPASIVEDLYLDGPPRPGVQFTRILCRWPFWR